MGQYTFNNLKGFEEFARKACRGDIVITGKNFGCGSSRQQAVDCFLSLGIQAVIAESFGVIYERNAINSAFPAVTCPSLGEMELKEGDFIIVNLETGEIMNTRNMATYQANPFTCIQLKIFKRGGLLEN